MLTIAGSAYNPEHEALEVYVSGCTRGCLGCHNPELQKFGIGKRWERWLRENTYKLKNDSLVKAVWILGGDLMCHDLADVNEFLHSLRKVLPEGKQIALWTGQEESSKTLEASLKYLDWVKMGSYRKDLAFEGGMFDEQYYLTPSGEVKEIHLASTNQCIIMLKEYGYDDEDPRVKHR